MTAFWREGRFPRAQRGPRVSDGLVTPCRPWSAGEGEFVGGRYGLSAPAATDRQIRAGALNAPSAARVIFTSVPPYILSKIDDVRLCEEEAILAVLVRRARNKLAIYPAKCLVALSFEHVQQFWSRIRRI